VFAQKVGPFQKSANFGGFRHVGSFGRGEVKRQSFGLFRVADGPRFASPTSRLLLFATKYGCGAHTAKEIGGVVGCWCSR
jgi:hypothetical protein